jgi:hypothetical protein
VPTYEPLPRFWRDFDDLSDKQKRTFQDAVMLFKEGLVSGQFHPSLKVHRIDAAPGVYALSWGDDNEGRATFQYGKPKRRGEAHVIWRRVGTHAIYRRPQSITQVNDTSALRSP